MYDAGEADGVLYIAMRFVDGIDLATLIDREGPLEPGRASRIVAQVASALDAAADAGLVHRDVKPSNVLLPARGAGRGEHAYLGDFGLTKRVLSESGVTGSSAFIGTIAYVAPEQIEGRAVDARADQYSLACLAYECLTGHKPYERDTDIATLYAHIRDPFPSVGEVVGGDMGTAVDAVLARGGAKQPQDRYPSAGDLAEDLLRVTGASAPGTGPLPAVAPAKPRSGRRRRALVGVLGLVVLAVAAVAGIVALQNAGPSGPLLAGHGLVAIDTTTNAPRAAASFAAEPTAIAADATAAWITHFATAVVSRVDAASPNGLTEVEVGEGPQAVAAASVEDEPLVWVANVTDETLFTIEADEPDVRPSTQILQFRPGAMAYGDGFLWVIDTQSDSVVPLGGPRMGIADDPIQVDAGPISVAAGGGAVWVANELGESLSRIEFESAATPIALSFAPGPLALDVDSDALWIVDPAGDAVVRFNTRSRQEEARVELGARPTAVAVGAGAVWVVSASAGTVSRIDPATNTAVATIAIGGSPVGVAVAGTTVWVAVAES
jgi:YVTN family beta-propeller protein